MRTRLAALVVVLSAVAGCGLVERLQDRASARRHPPPAPATFSQYHLEGWEWDRVARVVVLPFRNESNYTRAGIEAREAFVAELQRAGRFEVIPTAHDDRAYLAADARCSGRFDEALILEVARDTGADVVVYGVVSNYSPYPRPRLGLVLQAVGPREAKVVASVDGLWDSTDLAIADRAYTYYRQGVRERPPWVRNHVIAGQDSFAYDQALESPNLYRRFVAREAVLALLGLPVPGVVMGAGGDEMTITGRVGCAPGCK